MRKLLLLSFLTIAWMSVKAVTPYKYMEFKTTENTSLVFEAEGLEIEINDGVLSLSNASGQKMNIDVSTLASMQFTDNPATIFNITFDSDSKIQVYKLDGTVVGNFPNISNAIYTLSPGIYILKSTEGQTVKIMIEK
ncbi:MAG: T9SS type A sorting domain-containing protein [Lachnospiraceae bacterium]|nr:T9SS type A sorting domain-containing protein [Lachnospiraceae bacterium]